MPTTCSAPRGTPSGPSSARRVSGTGRVAVDGAREPRVGALRAGRRPADRDGRVAAVVAARRRRAARRARRLRATEVLRAAEVDAIAQARAARRSLAGRADRAFAPEPWSDVFAEHRDALRLLMTEIDGGGAENRQVLQAELRRFRMPAPAVRPQRRRGRGDGAARLPGRRWRRRPSAAVAAGLPGLAPDRLPTQLLGPGGGTRYWPLRDPRSLPMPIATPEAYADMLDRAKARRLRLPGDQLHLVGDAQRGAARVRRRGQRRHHPGLDRRRGVRRPARRSRTW